MLFRSAAKNEMLRRLYDHAPLEAAPIIDAYLGFAARLRPYIADTSLLLNEALDQGKTVLCEGAQGTLIASQSRNGVSSSTFVTSSYTLSGAEADAITDYTALFYRFIVNKP